MSERLSKSAIFKVLILFIVFINWIFPFINTENYLFFENFGLVLVGVIGLLSLLFIKDTVLCLELVLLVPFMFSHSMNFYSVPVYLIICCGLVVIGMIAHLIIYKPRLKKPRLVVGLSLLAFSMVVGGLFVQTENKLINIILLLLISIAFIFIYIFFTSTTNCDFSEISLVCSMLGILLIMETVVSIIINPDTLFKKVMNVGWGISNNIAMIMLFIYPFTVYLGLKSKKIPSFLWFALSVVELVVIIISYSRGAIFAAFVSYLIFTIIMIVTLKDKDRRKYVIYFTSSISVLVISLFLSYLLKKDFFDAFIKNCFAINLESLNGRVPIYKDLLNKFVEKPIFGYGILGLYDENNIYTWGHNMFIQVGYTMGFVGLVALIVHFIEKYKYCIKIHSIPKLIILFSFIATDIYGFFDVSYFFINFMVVLLVILVLIDPLIKEVKKC